MNIENKVSRFTLDSVFFFIYFKTTLNIASFTRTQDFQLIQIKKLLELFKCFTSFTGHTEM